MSRPQDIWLEPIDPAIKDYSTLRQDHTVYTHLACVMLRCMVGGALILSRSYTSPKLRNTWVVFCLAVVVIFGSKYIAFSKLNRAVWKVYLRTVIIYAIAGISVYNDQYDRAGILVMVDALMGLQSRHMAFIASHLAAKK